MLIKRSPNGIELPFSSEITPRALYESRRQFIKQVAAGAMHRHSRPQLPHHD